MVKKNELRFLIKSDIIIGIMKKPIIFIAFGFIILIDCLHLNLQFSQYNQIFDTSFTAGAMDYLLYIFSGMNVYIPSPSAIFDIPITWLTFHLIILFAISNYISSSINTTGIQMLVRTRSRFKWYVSKCIWGFMTVIAFYVISFIVVSAISICNTSFSSDINNEVMNFVLRTSDETNFNSINIAAVILIPAITSLALAYFQMLLEIVTSSVLGYISSIVVLVLSAFTNTPLLFGNNSMLLRSELVMDGGIKVITAIIINIVVVILSLIIGYIAFKRKDILEKQ